MKFDTNIGDGKLFGKTFFCLPSIIIFCQLYRVDILKNVYVPKRSIKNMAHYLTAFQNCFFCNYLRFSQNIQTVYSVIFNIARNVH